MTQSTTSTVVVEVDVVEDVIVEDVEVFVEVFMVVSPREPQEDSPDVDPFVRIVQNISD